MTPKQVRNVIKIAEDAISELKKMDDQFLVVSKHSDGYGGFADCLGLDTFTIRKVIISEIERQLSLLEDYLKSLKEK
jgi:hypothetical protein